MEVKDMITKRKSFRSYEERIVEEDVIQQIKNYAKKIQPLYPDIKYYFEIVKREEVKCILKWLPPQIISIYSEKKEGSFENIGFIFQQLELFIQSLGLGTCWLGMGQPLVKQTNQQGYEHVMMIAFGYAKEDYRYDIAQFKRHSLKEISDIIDENLEPARLAPSSINSQPWYFLHDQNQIHVYCKTSFLHKMMHRMNLIDMGIALAHLYVSNPFDFIKQVNVPQLTHKKYIGTIQAR